MKHERKTQKISLSSKILIITLSIIFIIGVGLFIGFKYIFGDLSINKITDNSQDLGISEEAEDKYRDKQIENIALFGLDGRNEHVDEGRSDSLMVASINKETGKLKLISILRDSYVAIEGYPNQKINHAYAYGGPVLAIKTINQNFNLNIKNYVSLNFSQFTTVIDTIGGIDIYITEQELNEINGQSPADKLTNYGEVHLNGEQTLAYSRIRKIDSDNMRADRQKNVIQAIIKKLKSNNSNYVSIIKTILPSVETSFQYNDIMEYMTILSNKELEIEETTVPGDEENAQGGMFEGAWVWRYDLNKASDRIHQFIYS